MFSIFFVKTTIGYSLAHKNKLYMRGTDFCSKLDETEQGEGGLETGVITQKL